jgi:hypothetical protein
MLTFEVQHNGRRIARAGLRKGVLSAMLTWVSRDAKTSPDQLAPGDVIPGLDCRLGGLNTARPRHQEHIDWPTPTKIRLGDEFTIRVTRAGRPDRPARRRRSHVQTGRRKGLAVVRCSFCDRDRLERSPSGRHGVVAGADVVICTQCIGVAESMLENSQPRALHFSRKKGKCLFCYRHQQKAVLRSRGKSICSECVKTTAGLV